MERGHGVLLRRSCSCESLIYVFLRTLGFQNATFNQTQRMQKMFGVELRLEWQEQQNKEAFNVSLN